MGFFIEDESVNQKAVLRPQMCFKVSSIDVPDSHFLIPVGRFESLQLQPSNHLTPLELLQIPPTPHQFARRLR